MLLVGLFFGLYNFIDWSLYELGSPFEPKLFASNPRLYSYPRMLIFLLMTPLIELASVALQPPRLVARDGLLRGIVEVPLALLRVLLAILNVPLGFIGLTVRACDVAVATAMGERPKVDVVAAARVRQGRIEARKMAVASAEAGVNLTEDVLRRWDATVTPPRG
jgi:hypothetical protein